MPCVNSQPNPLPVHPLTPTSPRSPTTKVESHANHIVSFDSDVPLGSSCSRTNLWWLWKIHDVQCAGSSSSDTVGFLDRGSSRSYSVCFQIRGCRCVALGDGFGRRRSKNIFRIWDVNNKISRSCVGDQFEQITFKKDSSKQSRFFFFCNCLFQRNERHLQLMLYKWLSGQREKERKNKKKQEHFFSSLCLLWILQLFQYQRKTLDQDPASTITNKKGIPSDCFDLRLACAKRD